VIRVRYVRIAAAALACLIVAIAGIGAAHAHELRPAYLELSNGPGSTYAMTWKVPVKQGLPLAVEPRFPPDCGLEGASERVISGSALIVRFSLTCEQSLAGRPILFDGLAGTLTDVLVRARWGSETEAARATAETPLVVLKGVPSSTGALATYFVLGFEHILMGFDHLLFVLALLLLTRGVGRLVKTITAFTIAHSLTLGLTATGWISVPSAPVEAVIALSIVFLAREIVIAARQAPDVIGRTSGQSLWMIAFAFGLLHGFGFAGALQEIGLPSDAILLALFAFNLGVEAGQLAFVLAVLLLVALVMRTENIRLLYRPAGYLIGITATVWFIERMVI